MQASSLRTSSTRTQCSAGLENWREFGAHDDSPGCSSVAPAERAVLRHSRQNPSWEAITHWTTSAGQEVTVLGPALAFVWGYVELVGSMDVVLRSMAMICATWFRKMSSRVVAQTVLAGLLAVGSLACGDDGDGGPPAQEVEDMLGRSCMLLSAAEVTCDQDPMPAAGCPSGTTACFQLGTTDNAAGPAAICAACCGPSSSTSTRGDCSNLVCSSADDCPPQYGRCMSGICRY